MTNTDFAAWHKRMGFTYESGAKALGMGRTTYYDYLKKEGQLPLWLALACAALEQGIQPIGVS